MKLIRFGPAGAEKPGLQLEDGSRLDVSAGFSNYDEAFFATDGISRLRQWLIANPSRTSVVDSQVRLGPPIARPGKIVCIGLNYRDHAEEFGTAPPPEPILFLKSTSALTGPHDGLLLPFGSEKTDWEVELAVVIGPVARRVSLDQAASHIAGYVLHNDYSERAWQLERGGQWVKGKSADTFAPLGPWLATPDEIPDPGQLDLWLSVNGVPKQKGHTSRLIFDIPYVIHYVSQFMTLLPGDVISTGTPAGIGMGRKPPEYLKPGDVVESGITFLGTQRQVARADV